MTSGRVVLLLTTPRVAPGLLAWPAWELLRSADRVLTGDPHHSQLPAIAAAGVAVETLDQPDAPLAVARTLLDAARAGRTLVWLTADDGDPGLADALGQLLAGQAEAGVPDLPELEVLPGSYDLPGSRLLDLLSVMDQLRDRCPWVKQQDHRSLVRYLIEEAYETVEAIETGDRTHLREELGDLLFQVVFHARLAEEHAESPWAIDDVAGDLVEKLVRRNPHVFGEATPADVAEIENVWDQLKLAEKRRTSAVEGVPLGLPGLTLAEKLLGRTSRAGLDLPLPRVEPLPDQPTAEQLGEALFGLVNAAREAGLDPEQALRDACRRYIAAVHAAESGSGSGS
ncbi:MazG nucleotide pyrophosphohydrolase domain-containing protein [Actinopolymorpha alba]|uniref:MazG nucleotide pyrophosphohydrolase domain-containing protein n=1 Tax=Actinopolymorpha alba TaxID=533267 RepID=UPI0003804199|nr:MazG nucleotide pyrophosphohydrolase domain-containing protein [Actinopolymorpha alba]